MDHSGSRWRVRLDGEAPDLALLKRNLPDGDTVVGLDPRGAFLQTLDFERYSTADEVRPPLRGF